MLGIDKTTISRFANPTEAFLKKVLHPEELAEYYKAEDKARFLAARWAIKEALYKADNHNKYFHQIKIQKRDGKYLYPGFAISTTSENDTYIAVVMKEK